MSCIRSINPGFNFFKQRVWVTHIRFWIIIVMLLIGFMVTGCASPSSGKNAVGTARLTEAELADQLNEFSDRFTTQVTSTANRISRDSEDRAIRKICLLWKIRSSTMIQDAILANHPQKAFLDAATLTVQMRKFLENPNSTGATLLGDHQQGALDTAVRLENDIFQIGSLFLNAEQLENLKQDIDTYTDENPMAGTFNLAAARSAKAQSSQSQMFDWVTAIPMAPFRALEGIDSGAQAISAFNVIAGQFSRIVEDMPEQTRWHAELLLYELEERQFTVDALDSFNKVALSAESLSQTAQTLPADLRKEVTLALQDFESQQQQLQQTLNTLDGTIERATLMLDSVYAAGDNVAQAGESWREVFETIGALGGDKSEDPSEPSRPFDIREYTATAERLTEAAAELRSLVNEINQTLQNEKVSTLPAQALQDAETRGRSVTDHAAWRVLQLMAAAFILMIVYRLISQRIGRKPSA